VLEGLAALSRKRWIYVLAGVLVTIAVIAPELGGADAGATTVPTSTTSPWAGAPVRSTTTAPGPTSAPPTVTASSVGPTVEPATPTTVPPTAVPSTTVPSTTVPPTTVPPTTVPTTATTTSTTVATTPSTSRSILADTSAPPAPTIPALPVPTSASVRTAGTGTDSGTDAVVVETAMPGEDPNPGELYPGRPDIRPKDRERSAGLDASPARFSGWSAWIARQTVETTAPDGRTGRWLKITVRLVNRDTGPQTLGERRWVLLGPDGINRVTEYATPTFVNGSSVIGGGEAWGELWFPAPATGGSWLSFRPDQASDRGVWAVDGTA
jgi:hypothetical protein